MFGAEAFAKVLSPLKKLDKRSERYTFVRYAPTEYRLWNSTRRKIKISRDVKFKINKIKPGQTIKVRTEEENEETAEQEEEIRD